MTHTHHSRILAGFLAVFACAATPVLAQDALALQVTAAATQSEPVELSLEALDALDQTTFTTSTIWTDGETRFSGVPLKALLAHLGAQGSTVEMVALNDYAVTMPVAELEDDAPIIATRMNGETMSVRDKGPYWVVFPYDSDPKYKTEVNYSRSIWQLNRVRVMD
jgi:hypothetical protein